MKSSALNGTAYRIYKMLTWLRESPLSTEELNQRFFEEPLIQRRLSEDSLWLYINTLKLLGCEISRPVPTNGFRHELTRHPFGMLLSPQDIQTMIQVKAIAEKQFAYDKVLDLDGFLKTIVRHSAFLNRDDHILEIFEKSRSVDYEGQLPKIQALQLAVREQHLLFLTYQSPLKGPEYFYFLPEELVYQSGVLYLRGSQLGREDLGLLRIERILDFTLGDKEGADAAIYSQLCENRGDLPTVRLQLFGIGPHDFDSYGMNEKIETVLKGPPRCMQVVLQTRNFFLLKQKLLEGGCPFRILEPASFQAEMIDTLTQMKTHYEQPVT